MDLSCYLCEASARAAYVCIPCETLLRHNLIGPEEVYRLLTCAFHEAAVDVPLKKHLMEKHEEAPRVDLGKAFRREKP